MAETHIPYELETPRGTLYFNTYDANGNGYRIEQVGGLDSAVLRSTVENRPQAPGAIVFPGIDGARYPILSGIIRVTDADEALNLVRRRELEDKFRSCASSLKPGPLGTLRWTPSGAPMRRLGAVQLIDQPFVSGSAGSVVKEWSLALIAGDPMVYSDTEFEASTVALAPGVGSWGFPFSFPFSFGSASTGGSVLLYNGGDEPAWPKVRIYGSCVAPRVANLTLGQAVNLPGLAIPAGNYAEVDMLNETVYLNGSDALSLGGSIDSISSEFWQLGLGDNAIQLTASAFVAGARASVVWRDCYA